MPAINTATCRRRSLRFNSIDECLAEVDRVAAAEQAGRLQCAGNWTVGQIFGHIAAWIEYGYDGYPLKAPWFIRMILRLRLKKYLRDGLPAGVHIPQSPEGTFGTDRMSTEEGAARLRHAFERLKRGENARFDSPGFGPMSHEQRVQLNLRHAELHMSFLHPK